MRGPRISQMRKRIIAYSWALLALGPIGGACWADDSPATGAEITLQTVDQVFRTADDVQLTSFLGESSVTSLPIVPAPTEPQRISYESIAAEPAATRYYQTCPVCSPAAPEVFGESWKNVPLGFMDGLGFLDASTLTFGGELRHRYMDEDNRLRPRNPGDPNESTYHLIRWRNWIDFKMGDAFRVYVEMLDASIHDNELFPLPIDVNRWNIQDLFIDAKIAELDDKPVYLRAGRQDLQYGAQRLVSPLDWSNTRRNFEGFKLMSKGDVWDVDMFATRPVNTATGRSLQEFDHERDKADSSRWFSGVYSTYKGIQGHAFDLYWLWLQTDAANHNVNLADGNRHTVGLRWTTKGEVYDDCGQLSHVWTTDTEGGYQFGSDNGQDVQAGFFTTKTGVTLSQLPWKPNITGLFYWGSGDDDPNDNTNNTFDVYFPLGHAYWGIIDNLSGQNLIDYSVQGSVSPTEKLTVVGAMHWFDLATQNDRLYNVANVPLGGTGNGTDIGTEFDLIGTYKFNPNFNVQVGYSWFWNQDVVNALGRGDANQLYVQTTFKY